MLSTTCGNFSGLRTILNNKSIFNSSIRDEYEMFLRNPKKIPLIKYYVLCALRTRYIHDILNVMSYGIYCDIFLLNGYHHLFKKNKILWLASLINNFHCMIKYLHNIRRDCAQISYIIGTYLNNIVIDWLKSKNKHYYRKTIVNVIKKKYFFS